MPITNVFPIALLLAFALTPLAIRFAWAVGYLDHPEARKLHESATALLGARASSSRRWLPGLLTHW